MVHNELGPLAVATFAECRSVMKARNLSPIDLPGYKVGGLAKVMGLPTFFARKILAKVTAKEAKGKSSMAQDFARGRAQTEITEINGVIVDECKKLNLPCPANIHLIKRIEDATLNPDKLQEFINRPELVAKGFKV